MHVWHLNSDTEFSFCTLCNRLLCYLTTNKMPAASQDGGYSSPHNTIPQVLLPWGLSPPVETFQSILQRRRIYLESQPDGTLNFQLYLLAVNSDLYSHNKGWQEPLGSELIFIPTIAAHTNQHPLLDIYCFAQHWLLCSCWKQRTVSIVRIKQVVCFPWSLHTLVFCWEATVHHNFLQPLVLNESQQISQCCLQ